MIRIGVSGMRPFCPLINSYYYTADTNDHEPAPVANIANLRPSFAMNERPPGSELAALPLLHTTLPDCVIVPEFALMIGTCTSPCDPPGTVILTVASTCPLPSSFKSSTAVGVAKGVAEPPLHATRTMSWRFGSVGGGGTGPVTQTCAAFGLPTLSHAAAQPPAFPWGHQCVACTHRHDVVVFDPSDVAPVQCGRAALIWLSQSAAQKMSQSQLPLSPGAST